MPEDPRQVSFAIGTGITFAAPPIDEDTGEAEVGGSRSSSCGTSETPMVNPAALARVVVGPPAGGRRAPCVLDAPAIEDVYFPKFGTAIHPRDIGHASREMPQAIEANRRPTPLDMDRIAQGSHPSGLRSPTFSELCQATSDGPVKTPTFDTILPADRLASLLADAEHSEDIHIRKDVGKKSVAAIKRENSGRSICATTVTQASRSTGDAADVYRSMLSSATTSYSGSSGHALPMVNAAHAAGIPRGPPVKQPLRPRPLPGLPYNPGDTQNGFFLPGKATNPKAAPQPYYPERFQLYDAGVKDIEAEIMFDTKWQLSGGMDAVRGGRRRAVSKMERSEEEDQVKNRTLLREAGLKESEKRHAELMAGLKAAQVGEVRGATFSKILGDAGLRSLGGKKKKRIEVFRLFNG